MIRAFAGVMVCSGMTAYLYRDLPTRLARRSSSAIDDVTVVRAGTTLLELLLALLVIGAMLALAIQPMSGALDRTAVRSAMAEMGSIFASAREQAIESRSEVVVRVDSAFGTLRVTAGFAEVLERRLGEVYGVRLSATRDSMAYDPRGLGLGASNLSIVVQRGRVSDTLYLSRLGRVRW